MRIYGITGWRNSGKTTLVERLVTEITSRGYSVSTIKHAHHNFDVDQPGRDSYRHRRAGAVQVLVSCRNRWALMSELHGDPEPPLESLIAKLEPTDLVLVEGYKRDRHPKIETRRVETAQNLIAEDDTTIEAIATDGPLPGMPVPVFSLDDIAGLADFILTRTGLLQNPRDTTPSAPKLRNDCFALPPGVDWVPVDDALDRLRDGIEPVTATETLPVAQAGHRVLARHVQANRSHPPAPNSAVDGYGFLHASLTGAQAVLPLVEGRSAAGSPFDGPVPLGHAVRILTGALLPQGVDTVVLQEDVAHDANTIRFENRISKGSNTREAGEDKKTGAIILDQGQILRPQDIALAAATGAAELPVFRQLRVAVCSTGDEIVPPSPDAPPHQTFDANRPMLLDLARRWGMQAVDAGHVSDDPDALHRALDRAAERADVILTSGGASAGDEDHISKVLRAGGTLETWRIAIKPGRPLALGTWNGTPVFGLPGNPVAALVCSLIFARPALLKLSGASWRAPTGYPLPAAFTKSKKQGRREYLRARPNAKGEAEVFESEGSGRISGLSWAQGLVELDETAQKISPGDPVRYIPFSEFGL